MGRRRWPDWTWQLIPPEPFGAHLQMALDEVLLTEVQHGRRPATVRFWAWSEPALVLGSHQSVRNEVDEARARARGYLITRRMSGGGTMVVAPEAVITYSLYAPAAIVAGLSFVDSFAHLDAWLVAALRELGVPAEHRPINDIACPEGKMGGAAQARRATAVLHHTTLAYRLDPALVPELIRIGRPRLTPLGIRSAEKAVVPLTAFLTLGWTETVAALEAAFACGVPAEPGEITACELSTAAELARSKYGSEAWIRRLA